MTPSTSAEYDSVPYPSHIFAQTHPDRLATIATLYGLRSADPLRCRVLELGCGDGGNLAAMAALMPNAEFIGLDLSAEAVSRGQQTVRAIGLSNITLLHRDLMHAPADLGRFDYIIAHGLYSWVPEPVRDRVMGLCADHLGDQGVAYISYNAYPGNHLRDIIRRITRFHTRTIQDPNEQVRQARGLVKFLAESKPEPGLWQTIMHQQLNRMASYSIEGYYHDDLSPVNDPSYFYEFVEHAARHGLQYLAEANLTDMLDDEFPREVIARLECSGPGTVLAREQYLDFLKGRSFRQTLLCHHSLKLDRNLNPDTILSLHVAGEIEPVDAGTDLTGKSELEFRGGRNAVIATDHPVAKAALAELADVWPDRIHFSELLGRARKRSGRASSSGNPNADQDALTLGKFLIRAYQVGFVELHSMPAPFIPTVTERPLASALTRHQIRLGPEVSTGRHITLRLDDEFSRALLGMLDGTNDRAAILRGGSRILRDHPEAILKDGKPAQSPEEAMAYLEQQLDPFLNFLARSGLLAG